MTKEQLDALIEFIRAAAVEAADYSGREESPYNSWKEEAALRKAFEEPK